MRWLYDPPPPENIILISLPPLPPPAPTPFLKIDKRPSIATFSWRASTKTNRDGRGTTLLQYLAGAETSRRCWKDMSESAVFELKLQIQHLEEKLTFLAGGTNGAELVAVLMEKDAELEQNVSKQWHLSSDRRLLL